MFCRFTSQERTNVHRTAFFLHPPDFSLSKVTALKVVFGERTLLGAAKSQEVTFPRVSRRRRHFANVGDVIIYPDLVVARTDIDNRVEIYIIRERNVKNITFQSRFVFNPFSPAAC